MDTSFVHNIIEQYFLTNINYDFHTINSLISEINEEL